MFAALTLAVATTLPSISLHVSASPNVSRTVVIHALEEARDIWLEAGVQLSWRGEEAGAASLSLRVVIDDDPGIDVGPVLAIGWVVFNGDDPLPEIHLSYRNALNGLTRSCPAGSLIRMTKVGIDDVVAMALGRALAHEVGHYLLGQGHTAGGLMRADWEPGELFGDHRLSFHLDSAQRAKIASRLMTATVVTKR